jgi:hypothetical protein
MPAASRQPHGERLTAAQRAYLNGFVRRGVLRKVDTTTLTKQQASALITSVIQRQRRVKVAQQQEIQERTSGFDNIRFGLCVKLVFRNTNYMVSNPEHMEVFRNAVKHLYNVVTHLEAEMREERRGDEDG